MMFEQYFAPVLDMADLQSFRLYQKKTRIFLIDPYSADLAQRWKDLAPGRVNMVTLPGLPEALDIQWI